MTDIILSDPLSGPERHRLGELESAIRHGLQSFIEAGQALTEVRDSRLYREEFVTFEEYCDQRWSLSKTHGNRLIQAAEVVAVLPAGPENGVTPIGVTPSNEAQARELAPLLDNPEKLRETWQRAVDVTGGRPTAAAVRDAREQVAPRPPVPSRSYPSAPWQAPTPAAPIHSEPSMFTDVEIVDAEIVEPDAPAPWIENAAREAAEQLAEVKATFDEAAQREAELSALPGAETFDQRIRREQPYANAAIKIRQAIEEIPLHLNPADLAGRVPDYSEHNVNRLPEALAWLAAFNTAYQARRTAVA